MSAPDVTGRDKPATGVSGRASRMTQDNWRGKLSTAYTKAGFGEAAYQQRLARMGQQQGGRWVQIGTTPLSASQHILHLLLTVFTAGLWTPVWIIRAAQGNKQMA
jgi:hypothetical protein